MGWSLNAVTIKLNYTINYNSFCSAALAKASGSSNYDLAFKQGGIFLTWLVNQAYFFLLRKAGFIKTWSLAQTLHG